MKTVITYGTFDLFHIGHLNLLARMAALGDRLVVGVSTDEFNSLKGKRTIISYEDRARIVAAIRHVDAVFPEQNWQQKRADIAREQADIFAMGNDWSGKFDELRDICQVIYLPRTENISTTDIRMYIRAEARNEMIEAAHMVETAHRFLQNLITPDAGAVGEFRALREIKTGQK